MQSSLLNLFELRLEFAAVRLLLLEVDVAAVVEVGWFRNRQGGLRRPLLAVELEDVETNNVLQKSLTGYVEKDNINQTKSSPYFGGLSVTLLRVRVCNKKTFCGRTPFITRRLGSFTHFKENNYNNANVLLLTTV